MGAALAEQVAAAAVGQGGAQLGEVDAVLAEHQHVVVAEERAGLVEVLGVAAQVAISTRPALGAAQRARHLTAAADQDDRRSAGR